MKHAKFTYQLVEYKGYRCIIVVDEKALFDNSRKSVTEDINNVVDQIELAEKIRAEQFIIVYRDAALTYDGWNAATQKFYVLQKLDWTAAVQKVIYLQLGTQQNKPIIHQ